MNIKELYENSVKELEIFTTLENPDFQLEQYEFLEKEKKYEIVISFLVENNKSVKKDHFVPSFDEFMARPIRQYKKVVIDEEGKVLGVFIFDK